MYKFIILLLILMLISSSLYAGTNIPSIISDCSVCNEALEAGKKAVASLQRDIELKDLKINFLEERGKLQNNHIEELEHPYFFQTKEFFFLIGASMVVLSVFAIKQINK